MANPTKDTTLAQIAARSAAYKNNPFRFGQPFFYFAKLVKDYVDGAQTVPLTFTSTFTWDNAGGTTAALTVKYSNIGDRILVEIPTASVASAAASVALVGNTAIPVGFRPVQEIRLPVQLLINATRQAGVLIVSTAGVMSFRLITEGTTGTTAASGTTAAHTVSFFNA